METKDQNIQRLRSEMERKKLSARELSLRAGLNESAVKKILSGASASPRLETWRRLAEALEISPQVFLGDLVQGEVVTTVLRPSETERTVIARYFRQQSKPLDPSLVREGMPQPETSYPGFSFTDAAKLQSDPHVQRRMLAIELALQLSRNQPDKSRIEDLIKAASTLEAYLRDGTLPEK